MAIWVPRRSGVISRPQKEAAGKLCVLSGMLMLLNIAVHVSAVVLLEMVLYRASFYDQAVDVPFVPCFLAAK